MGNGYMNSHLLCFDPAYKKQTGVFQGVCYEGSARWIAAEKTVEENEDGSVTFSYYQPEAESVEIEYFVPDEENRFALKKMRVRMNRGEDGYWKAKLYLSEGYHDIFYLENGVRVINTHQSYGYDGDSIYNFVDLTKDRDFWLQDVPHGRLTREIYLSAVTGRYRACWVYTPADYLTSAKKYPLLCVQHGGGEDEICWSHGREGI